MSSTNAAATSPQQGEGSGSSLTQKLIQGVGVFIITQWVVSQFFGSKSAQPAGPAAPATAGDFSSRPELTSIANYSGIPTMLSPIWAKDSRLNIRVLVAPSLQLPPLASLPSESLVLSEDNFHMGDYKYSQDFRKTIKVPSEVQHNGSWYAHILAGLHGSELDPHAKSYNSSEAAHYVRQLNHYIPKKRQRKVRNLLGGKNETIEEPLEEPKAKPIANYWHSNFSLVVVPDAGTVNWRSMHPGLRKNVQMEPTDARDASGQNGWYYPVVYLNRFWQLRSHMTELNDTVKEVAININLQNMAHWKYSIVASMEEGLQQQAQQAAAGSPGPTGGDGSEFEMLKEILLDTNSYLLATTAFASVLHMIFEGLAFKNDISHWRKKKDNVGTSVRTIIANVVMQLIIFLYLMDNNENTSWMILAGQGFGILVEAWKITKTANVVVRPPGPDSLFRFLPYVVKLEDKHQLSETEKRTEEYDKEAFYYLYIVAVPLLLAYAAYSLVYETHKSWYSFVIETLVGSVYAYGFLMMVPALFINYRLKSVSHMPGKAMTYKFLNTFIDDLFAFTIRMPILHRLATLRDDVIFFIWLYQKWIYKVDYKRVNEFGQGGESEDEAEQEKESTKALAGQSTKELKPSQPVANASGADRKSAGTKKRK